MDKKKWNIALIGRVAAWWRLFVAQLVHRNGHAASPSNLSLMLTHSQPRPGAAARRRLADLDVRQSARVAILAVLIGWLAFC